MPVCGTIHHNATEGGRPDGRRGRLRAEGQWYHPVADGGRRATRRAPRGAVRITRMPGFAWEHIGKLGRDRFAHHDAPSLPCQSDTRGITCWVMALVDGRAVCGRHVVGINDVLHPEW